MLYFMSLFGLAAVTGLGIGGPGDAALVAAGVLASQGHVSLAVVVVLAAIALLHRYLWQRGHPRETDVTIDSTTPKTA